jgi:hypothetical protein
MRKLDARSRPPAAIWFHRSRAVVWVIVGVISFPLGWANSVVLVWIASVYANISGDIGAAAAADDRAVIERLDRVDLRLAHIESGHRRGALDRPAGARLGYRRIPTR